MNSSSTLRSIAFVVLLLGGAVFVSHGCTNQEATPRVGQSMVEFLELRALDAAAKDLNPRMVRQLSVTKPSNWTVENAKQRVQVIKKPQEGMPGTVLVVSEAEPKCSVAFPGPFDPQAFNLIALQFRAPSKFECSFDFMSGGKRVSFTPPRVITPEAGKGLRTILIEAPHLRRIKGDVDEIVLQIRDMKNTIWIAEMGLLWQPDHQFLPSTGAGPKPVLVGDEMRNAVGVSSSLRVGATVEARENGLLRFSYGTPGELTRPGTSPRLQMNLRSASGAEHQETYELDTNFRKARWRQALVDLSPWAGEEVEVAWSVLTQEGEGVCALGEVTAAKRGGNASTVIFITSDTHRGDHMGGATEGVNVETPMLDALGARGVFFEDCFSTTNITNPSHIALMTGVHPRDTGIVNNYTRVADAAPTLAEAFREAGYITYASVSTRHLSDPTSGLGQGFERASYPLRDFARDGAETIKVLEDWLDESEGLPVFVWLHLFDAHMPYDKDVPQIGKYYGNKSDAFDDSLPELGSPVQKAINNLRLPGLRDLEFPRALYKAEITQLDERLGEFLARPAFQSAVIAFTADHGESLGNHDIYFAHEELYRESLHVPLILSWPGGPKGVRYREPVSNLNIGRTLLDLSGNLDAEFPGENLALIIESEASDEPRYTLSAHAREVAVTQNGWHFQLRLGPNDLADGTSTRERHQTELYYLPDDPACAKDLLDAEFARAKEMRRLALRWLEAKQDLGWVGGDSGDAETMAKLKALGYTGGDTAGASTDIAVKPDCGCSWCARFE